MFKYIIAFIFIAFGNLLIAQKNVTTFGIQLKPLIPSTLLGTGLNENDGEENLYQLQQRIGYSFGGVMRKGFTNWLSLETGISYVKRNYEARVLNGATAFADTARFGIVGYEVPVSALVFVRLADQVYMDGSFGLALDFFPSDVENESRNNSFLVRSFRNSWAEKSEVMPWLNLGLMTNLGFEYRTKKSGYFYVGGSYHLPFKAAYNSFLIYDRNAIYEQGFMRLTGNYITIDFKYFFHEEPEKPKIPDEELPAWMREGNQ